jgi:predicted permease
MAVVVAALLPVFLLIVLGFILKRTLMRLETQWHGLERRRSRCRSRLRSWRCAS